MTKRQDSNFEASFDWFLSQLATDLPAPEKNYRFDPNSKLEIDRAWVGIKVGVELCGGIWKRGKSGHSSGTGIRRDYRKSNVATLLGWRLLWFSPDMLEDNPTECIAMVYALVAPLYGEIIRRASKSRYCQKCFIERFGTAQDKTNYAAEKAELREPKFIMPKTKPQRIESDKVKLKKVLWE